MTITTKALCSALQSTSATLAEQESLPRYRCIAKAVEQLMSTGVLSPGQKLPTHRALADVLSTTVGTVTRAYADCERRGLVEARVGSGTFIRSHGMPQWFFAAPEPEEGDSQEIDFGYNLPPAINREVMLQDAMNHLAADPAALNALLLYQPPEGIPEHRQVIVDWLQGHGFKLDADRLRFTSGAQNAMQLVLSTFCREGDCLLVEKMTYPGLINLARQQRLTLKPVDMDDEGLIPEALDNACRQYHPRFIYGTPTLQNPTVANMGRERRQQILEVCRRHDVIFIEDEVNGLQPASRTEPMVNLDPEQVIFIGALSKNLAPGLRVGFVQVPKAMTRRLTMTIQNQCWMVSPLLTGLACELIRRGHADQTLSAVRTEMQARFRLAGDILQGQTFKAEEGCFHLWLTLPEHWPLSAFLSACEERGVKVKSGELFVPPGYPVPPAVRIAMSAPRFRRDVETGLKIVAEILASEPELTDSA
ncbi:PLP-dependent aminotransferase family protein [Parendozoicomonas haliclonae]|uniref:Putative HTH-type transcriptional regulator YjiR n=1 Tax=Parendozoicomonas haliclonae TaxID=1960125 RepID=A0A1X7ANA8_9GAMM|nr:PLP-dependent aminotransferase family protein [Parendozoicomonas haliclonae]SMA49784.1 putative HTH-type transcriptional regulator YjiR [Parendozoicomonas haliclonae]